MEKYRVTVNYLKDGRETTDHYFADSFTAANALLNDKMIGIMQVQFERPLPDLSKPVPPPSVRWISGWTEQVRR